ncbi:MAG: hypothetical protein R3331_11545 [Sulfurospirillaceae bacterium]|nr:hypothetical protein [Sulfurospirillaceae bacterium]
MKTSLKYLAAGALLAAALVDNANAIPAFARQTGLNCSACHTVFPELTQTGRDFKLHGYTTEGGDTSLASKFAAMIQVTSTMNKHSTAADHALKIPQSSIFFGGKITDHVGAFVQTTLDDAGIFGADNMDFRYANSTKAKGMFIDYGFTVNNSPTVQDLWNSTSAWGYPYAGGVNNGGTKLDGLDNVVGLGAYAMWNNWLYTEFDAYKGSKASGLLNVFHFSTDTAANIKDIGGAGYDYADGISPYARIALQHNFGDNYVMVGAQYLRSKVIGHYYDPTPDAAVTYKDHAFDAEWQYNHGDHLITAQASKTWETQSGGATDKLETNKAKISYFYKQKYGITLDYVSDSLNSATQNAGTTVQFDYVPTEKIRLAAQFNNYTKFGGTSVGASDNNNVFLIGWFMF